MKKISDICKRLRIKGTNLEKDYAITGITIDSRTSGNGMVYFVTEGNEEYVDEAMKKGIVCLIAEKAFDYPCIIVDDVCESLALACSDFYDNPEKKLKMIGVVGTNGKTSVTHILYDLCKEKKKTGVIGTLGIYIGDRKIDTGMTTPDPILLFGALNEAVEAAMEYMFCEVTAHAIFFKKIYGIRFDACLFTNITQDHLDFFGSMEKYSSVKTGFFTKENMKLAIINADDEYGREMLKKEDICCISYGIEQPSDVFAIDIEQKCGLKFIANAFDDIIFAESRLEGRFNVYNLLAGIACAKIMGFSSQEIEEGIKRMKPIEGRANVICFSPKIVIDFAHTPDGLKNILYSLKRETKGKLIAVFGCGGNRDKTKRPIMGKIGTDIADVCIITSDNPRFENPDKIIDDIISELGEKDNYIRITDRTNAIEFAVKLATEDDCIAICGKGGENYIEINGEKKPYNDKKVCITALAKANWLRS